MTRAEILDEAKNAFVRTGRASTALPRTALNL